MRFMNEWSSKIITDDFVFPYDRIMINLANYNSKRFSFYGHKLKKYTHYSSWSGRKIRQSSNAETKTRTSILAYFIHLALYTCAKVVYNLRAYYIVNYYFNTY